MASILKALRHRSK